MRTLRQDKRQLVALFVALTPGIVVLGMPTEGQAQSTTISGVKVVIDGTTYQLWSSQAISAGQTLVLAQNPNNTGTPFNFDTSDLARANCVVGTVSGTATSFLGSSTTFSFLDSTHVLTPTVGGIPCQNNGSLNEAQNYTQIGQFISDGLQITVFVGYADNAHSDACGADVPNGSPSCFPSPFDGAANFFQGSAQGILNVTCLHGVAPCYDSGVILFTAKLISTSTTGFMTGGGQTANFAASHGFEVGCSVNSNHNNLEVNWAGGNNFHMDTITSVTCFLDPALPNPAPPPAGFNVMILHGTGTFNNQPGASVFAIFTDAGEPGTNDEAQIIVTFNGSTVLDVPLAKIATGDQQAHR